MLQVLLRFNIRDLFEFTTQDGLRIGVGYPILLWLLVGGYNVWKMVGLHRRNLDPGGSDIQKSKSESADQLLNETKSQHKADLLFSLMMILGIPAAIIIAGQLKPDLAPDGVPVFGYGFMYFIGFSLAVYSATRRAALVGIHSEVIMDLAMWLLIPGIVGARLFYVIQYQERVLGKARNAFETFKAIVMLPDGGLVFYGGLIAGIIGFSLFCFRRQLKVLMMADIVVPSLFIGLGFGRIGCFLYGCCFGDRCTLPWAVQFPKDSMPFNTLVSRGFLSPEAASTFALHPSQLYSSISAFVLAGLLAVYFRHRPWNGAVLAVAWVLYPINRFVLEFIRGDELGQFNTSMTISQLVSIGLLLTGVAYIVWMAISSRNKLSPAKAPPLPVPHPAS